jgi:hypothetical protein
MRRERPLVSKVERRKGMSFHPDVVRKRIQAAKLVDRLQDHIFDRLAKPLDISQVRAIDLLLKKCIPDLTRTLISADVNVRYVAELPKVLTKEEWLRKYGTDHLELTAEPLQITNGGGNGEAH